MTAFRDAATGRFAVVAINDSTEPASLQFDFPGYAVRNVTPWVTSADLNLERQAEIPATDEGFGAKLAASSVTTFAGDAVRRAKN